MAASAVPASTTAALAGRQTVFIDTGLIDLDDRLREIDWDWAEALKVIFDRDGMDSPIEVAPKGDRYRLVFGAHRWAAHQLLERPIEAFVVDKDWAKARAAEITENLHRRDLSPIERATFVAELYEVEKARNGWEAGQTKQGFVASKRWAKDASATMALASGLAEATAEKVGLSRRTLFRDLAVYRALQPGLAQALRHAAPGTSAADLTALAKLPPEGQQGAARAIANGEGVAAVLAAHNPKPVQSAEDKRLSAFIGAFSRMGKREQRAALAELKEHLPAGVTIIGLGAVDA